MQSKFMEGFLTNLNEDAESWENDPNILFHILMEFVWIAKGVQDHAMGLLSQADKEMISTIFDELNAKPWDFSKQNDIVECTEQIIYNLARIVYKYFDPSKERLPYLFMQKLVDIGKILELAREKNPPKMKDNGQKDLEAKLNEISKRIDEIEARIANLQKYQKQIVEAMKAFKAGISILHEKTSTF